MQKTWKQVIDEYEKWWLSKGKGAGTAQNYIRAMRQIAEIECKCTEDEIYDKDFFVPSVELVNTYISDINDRFSASTVNNKKNGIKSFYEFFFEVGYISKEVDFEFEGLKKNKHKPQLLLTKDEIDEISNSCGVRERIMVQIAFETGLSRARIADLRIRQLLLEEGKMVIFPPSYDIDGLDRVNLNDQKVQEDMERVCNLSEELIENLKVMAQYVDNERRKMKKAGVKNIYDFLFMTEDIDIPSTSTMRSYVDKLRKHFFEKNEENLTQEDKEKIEERFTLERITLSARVWYLYIGESVEEVMLRHGVISKTLVTKYKKLINVYYPNKEHKFF